MKKKILKSIKSKIITVSVSFTLILTILIASLSYYFFNSYETKSIIRSAEFNLQLVSGLVEQDVNFLNTLCDWCSTNSQMISFLRKPYVSDATKLSVYKLFSEEYNNNHSNMYIQRIIVTDSNFTRMLQVGSTVTQTAPVNMDRLPDLFKSNGDKPDTWNKIISDPFATGRVIKTNTIPLIRPIYQSSSKRIIGYIYMQVNTAIITDRLKSYSTEPDSKLYFTIGDSTYQIENTNFIKISSDFVRKEQISSDALNDEKTRLYEITDKDGNERKLISYPVGRTSMVLSQTFPNQRIMQQRSIFQRLFFIVCIGVVLIGMLFTLYLNQIINSPVKKLRKKLASISKGDFSYSPEIEWNNEFGDVGRGINDLSRNVVVLMENLLADEKKKNELEYKMLLNQISPHFLYNTLESIKWMAIIQNATGIAEMTQALSRLLKIICKDESKLVPLKNEISFLDDYFLIQQYRYGGSITFKKDIDNDVTDVLIPKFSLQPVLENAIFHGIEPNGGVGTIYLEAHRKGETVEISLTDDGVGMDEQTIAKIFSGKEEEQPGILRQLGIFNVHKRIQYEFGEHFGLSIASKPGEFTKVTVKIPYTTTNKDDGEEK